MITASKLAGFVAAHAIWGMSDLGSLVPIFAYTTEDGQRHMERLVVEDDLEASVAYGKKKLDTYDGDLVDAALVYDAQISIDDEGQMDAIIVEMRAYFSLGSEVVIAIPYTPKESGKFRVHKPKLIVWKQCEDFDVNAVLECFFEGVQEHAEGAKVWDEALDESK